MTNDVKRLKERIAPVNKKNELRRYRLLGQNDKAAEMLIEEFFEKTFRLIENGNVYKTTSIENRVVELEKALSQLGAKIPENIKALKTYGDYYEMGYVNITKSDKDNQD